MSGIVLYVLLPPSRYVAGRCRVPCILVPLFSFPPVSGGGMEEGVQVQYYLVPLSSVSLVPDGGMEEGVLVKYNLVPPYSFSPVPGGGMKEVAPCITLVRTLPLPCSWWGNGGRGHFTLCRLSPLLSYPLA